MNVLWMLTIEILHYGSNILSLKCEIVKLIMQGIYGIEQSQFYQGLISSGTSTHTWRRCLEILQVMYG